LQELEQNAILNNESTESIQKELLNQLKKLDGIYRLKIDELLDGLDPFDAFDEEL
jgi:hypothetical protein